MILVMEITMIISFILMIMMMMMYFFSKNMKKNREKSSPFECGFDGLSMNRMPFSLQFYLVGIIFLIFDVEIALILPIIKMISCYIYLLSISFLIIIMILIIGLIIEWKEGALEWFK